MGVNERWWRRQNNRFVGVGGGGGRSGSGGGGAGGEGSRCEKYE